MHNRNHERKAAKILWLRQKPVGSTWRIVAACRGQPAKQWLSPRRLIRSLCAPCPCKPLEMSSHDIWQWFPQNRSIDHFEPQLLAAKSCIQSFAFELLKSDACSTPKVCLQGLGKHWASSSSDHAKSYELSQRSGLWASELQGKGDFRVLGDLVASNLGVIDERHAHSSRTCCSSGEDFSNRQLPQP